MTNISTTPHIHRAILAAQRALRTVPRDGRNADVGYDFTKADTMIARATKALLEQGVTVRRRGHTIGDDGAKVISRFEISHAESGEFLEETFELAVHYDGEQEPDKAVLAASTTAWGYYLRDLLALERKDGNEVDTRRTAPRSYGPPQLQADDGASMRAPHGDDRRAILERAGIRRAQWQDELLARFGDRPLRELEQCARAEFEAWKRRKDMKGASRAGGNRYSN